MASERLTLRRLGWFTGAGAMIVQKPGAPRRSKASLRQTVLSKRGTHGAESPGAKPGLQTLRAARAWAVRNSFSVPWLPAPLAGPLAGYVMAVALQIGATLVTLLLVTREPHFSFPDMLCILAIALVALTWGAAPSLLATLLATILLETVVLPFTFHGGISHVGNIVEIAISLGVGATISVAASRTERARRRAVRKVAQSEAREHVLREINARTDEFISIASHELRAPLTSLKAAMQLSERRLHKLVENTDGEDSKTQIESVVGLLRTAENQADRQNRLVSDLLDVSRIHANKLEFRMATVDLRSIVRDALDEQRLLWPGRPITLDEPGGDVQVVGDAQRLGQVVTNYVTNALKYSSDGSSVHVTLTVDAPMARVAIRDHGPGLSRVQQAHIWERFHRVPGVQQLSGSGAGLGLGLHITRTIVQRHGGSVGVESTPGIGSTFWFTMPLASGSPGDQ